MGGKNAIIVDDDADLDQAVAGTITSAFGYAGQKCSACSRLIVVGSAYDEVLARLGPAVQSLVVGAPHDPSTFVPPVISRAQQQKINGYIENGRKTAPLLVEGRRPLGDGSFVAPVVFVDVKAEDPLAREEIFGPVLSVFRVESFDEALKLALDSEYALTGGLYSRNPRNIEKARREFRTGSLYINRKTTGAIVGRHPSAVCSFRVWATRRAGRTTCCSSSSRGRSRRTRCVVALRRKASARRERGRYRPGPVMWVDFECTRSSRLWPESSSAYAPRRPALATEAAQ
jgi:acyl-CoA reductase-like NAD-dependent aldehyde dehydrogenase